jgi:hypothetical protein
MAVIPSGFLGCAGVGFDVHEFVLVIPTDTALEPTRLGAFGWLRVFGFACVFWSALERSASTYDFGEATPTPTPPGREGQIKRGALTPGSRSALRFFRRRPGANDCNPFGIF